MCNPVTLSYVRQNYWITQGRKTVQKVLRDCVICKRFNGRTLLPPPTANLPSYRLNCDYAFQNTGLDFAGPLYICENCCYSKNSTRKVYILLLTCATSRALHLELVHDLGTESFIRAIIRFFARRGYPDIVVHDNAKTFKSKDVKSFFISKGISQEFILAKAPWWGGFYERLVRNIKTTLRKVLGKSILSFEELQTVLCEVESTINSRPLTYLNEDDLESPLTPFHLIYGRNILRNQSLSNNKSFNDPSKRVKHISKLLEHFWKRFSTIYLGDLQQTNLYRKDSTINECPISVGDIVLLKEDSLPRNRWRMGRIEKLVIGRDGYCRGARISTSSSAGKQTTCSRPLQKLVPFTKHYESNENCTQSESACCSDTNNLRVKNKRKAALEGQELRRLREKFG